MLYIRTLDTPAYLVQGSASLEGERSYEDALANLLIFKANNTYDCFYVTIEKNTVLWIPLEEPNSVNLIIIMSFFSSAVLLVTLLWLLTCRLLGTCVKSPLCTVYIDGTLINKYGC